ncbi:MAG: LysR family transcriptional regulator [Clostridiaceae bacterium]|nr:LysR family transcriptional regulator [Clostridiaceae bacterium]
MYNLQHLKYAVEVARTGSISRAAENLYMGQPRLSRAIRELEEDSGLILFSRTSKGVTPTQKGADFLDKARMILAQIEELEAMYKPSDEAQQRFDLCAPRASYVAAAFVEFVRALNPEREIRLNYRETHAARAMQNVADGTNNLAVIRMQAIHEKYLFGAMDERELRRRSVAEFNARVLLARTHPLAGHEKLTPEDLEPYTELLHGDTSVPALPVTQARQLAHGAERSRTIAVYERASQFDLLTGVPGTYMWVSPMPPGDLERFDLVEKICDKPNNLYRDYLIYRRGYHFTEEDEMFYATLTQTVQRLGMLPAPNKA